MPDTEIIMPESFIAQHPEISKCRDELRRLIQTGIDTGVVEEMQYAWMEIVLGAITRARNRRERSRVGNRS